MLILAENNTFHALSMHFFIIQHYFNPFLSDWGKSWLFKSNAFLKSKKTACVVLPSSVALFQSSMTCISASIVLRPDKNSYCLLSFQMVSVYWRIFLTMIRSNVLQRDKVSALVCSFLLLLVL